MAAEALIGKAVDEAVELAIPPIKRGFNYLCCFTSNINTLKDEAKKLDDDVARIQGRVGRAEDNAEEILPAVKTLLENSNKIKAEATAILGKEEGVRSGCLKFGARFSLSREATKTADRVKELKEECSKYSGNETAISQPRPPPAREAVPLRNAYEFESRKQIEDDIMAVLRGGDVRMIGISGMGGLGKTTMAKRIMNRVFNDHVFEETVFAVVSQNVDKRKIQLEIGGSLGLKLEEKESDAVTEQKLRARLSDTKKTLLVLDDVWEPIELDEFGIPLDSKGCTIVITSRNKDTLSKMDVEKEFGMEILSEEEASFLFREKAGTCMDHADLKSIGEEIVKECEGLPIALVTLGAALKGEEGPSVWRNALTRLRQRNPDGLVAKFYTPLRLSYDLLSSKEDKYLFLLCCLFPEDANIPLELLAYFGKGLDIYEGITNLEELRDRVSAGVTKLKGRSLLLDSIEGDDHVRMHDVVRDVCIFIAKEEERIEGNNCSWISSFERLGEGTKLPTGFGSPNLNLLFLSCHRNYNPWREEALELDNTVFEWISNLRVLCIHNYRLLSLTQSLKNLKSLVLDSCDGLKTISFVGEFEYLEILICRNCSSIEELPSEIKGLDRLKLLELTGCRYLQRIGQGIISSLRGLEELKMLDSFNRWGSEDREESKNAGLRELRDLTNLRCLEIKIVDPALASEKIHLSSKIKRFDIRIRPSISTSIGFNVYSYNKRMVLELKREEAYLGNSILMQFVRDTEYLNLKGSGANSVDLTQCQNIRWLELTCCETITLMVNDATALPASIEHMILRYLPKLEGICDGPVSSNSFHNLKKLELVRLPALKHFWKSSSVPPLLTNLSSIYIEGCDILCNLGQLSIAGNNCLPELQQLLIRKCEMMEQVFLWSKTRNDSGSRNDHCIRFPKLEKILLDDLPNLATFYQGMGGFEFPLLTKLSIKECPKLKVMGCSMDIDDDSSHLFCEPEKVSFGNLKEISLEHNWNPLCGHKIPLSLLNGLEVLRISSLHGSRSLFSSSVARNLVNLRLLEITDCEEMLKVIEDYKEDVKEKVVSLGNDSGSQSHHCITKVFSKLGKVIKCDEMLKVTEDNKEDDEEKMPPNLFPKLEKLKLADLPKLVTFCEWKCDVKLPSLTIVTVKRCPDMENLSLGHVAAPDLDCFDTDLKHNLEIGVKVPFDSLKKLEINEIEKPLSGHKFFNGLIEIKVFKCSTRSLFTSSMARCLDNLEVLIIQKCNEMVKVIEEEENEEKMGSGAHERTLLFPKLKFIQLRDLFKLVSFCEWKCDIELPSLRDVDILDCPVLRSFTMGSIAAAPNLESVQINYTNIRGPKNLNSVVKQYMA